MPIKHLSLFMRPAVLLDFEIDSPRYLAYATQIAVLTLHMKNSAYLLLSCPAFLESFYYGVVGTPDCCTRGLCLPIVRVSTSRGIPLSLLGKTWCAIAKSSRVKIESLLCRR